MALVFRIEKKKSNKYKVYLKAVDGVQYCFKALACKATKKACENWITRFKQKPPTYQEGFLAKHLVYNANNEPKIFEKDKVIAKVLYHSLEQLTIIGDHQEWSQIITSPDKVTIHGYLNELEGQFPNLVFRVRPTANRYDKMAKVTFDDIKDRIVQTYSNKDIKGMCLPVDKTTYMKPHKRNRSITFWENK